MVFLPIDQVEKFDYIYLGILRLNMTRCFDSFIPMIPIHTITAISHEFMNLK